ncbi:hypothetical protein SOVF_212630 [Spinacia oleracea]|nr:hypothetical protein SOVF_212630 [Spinacia oleracea]
MKSVSGEVVSCETFPLSKAARVLSNFVAADNGASPAFAAYLRRASASFNELAQLHKEHKRLGSQTKVKKQHSHGIVTDRNFESVINSSKRRDLHLRGVNNSEEEAGRIDVSLNVDVETRRHKSKNRRDGGEGKHNAGSSAVSMEVDRNMKDVGGAGKKSKIKKESSDGVNAIEVKNDTESFDGSKEKKKKKRVKLEKESNDGTQTVENNGDEPKKHKKRKNKSEIKEESISGGVKVEEPRNDSMGDHIENVVKGSKAKKHKKKRNRQEKERESEGKIKIESSNNKESRKRKHESVAVGELQGSQEKHKSKKKRSS